MPKHLCNKCVKELKGQMKKLGVRRVRKLKYVLDLNSNEVWMDDFDKVYLRRKTRPFVGPSRRMSPVLVREIHDDDRKRMREALKRTGMQVHIEDWVNASLIMDEWEKEDIVETPKDLNEKVIKMEPGRSGRSWSDDEQSDGDCHN